MLYAPQGVKGSDDDDDDELTDYFQQAFFCFVSQLVTKCFTHAASRYAQWNSSQTEAGNHLQKYTTSSPR
jgi:hypothetical protein